MPLSNASATLGATLDAIVSTSQTAINNYDAVIAAWASALMANDASLTQAQATAAAKLARTQILGPPGWRAPFDAAVANAVATWYQTVLPNDS